VVALKNKNREKRKNMYFEIHKNLRQEQPYWWIIKSSGNHATLAHSEMYKNKADCVHAISLIARTASTALYYDKTGEN
jgi:uncharacterized protein YegP (UPF0339 family)